MPPVCGACFMPIHARDMGACSEDCRAEIEARLLREAEAMADDRFERAVREEMAGRGDVRKELGR